MSLIKRRHFLQFAGAAIASLVCNPNHWIAQAEQTARMLAQPTRRKLALLIGINDYASEIYSLKGCLTDVAMQYELLRHRYGFHPADILVLTDASEQKPTRANILAAFETHLIQQAKPGDVVVFHYSGHGSRILDPTPLDQTRLNGTLVPADCQVGDRNDIMGRTLFLLSSQLQTDFVTLILDSCHAGGGLRGNHVVRALMQSQSTTASLAKPSAAEWHYQQLQLQKLGWSESEFQTRRRQGIAKGVAIGSTTPDWLALDACFGDFHAGAFTYLLTRYLWQLPNAEPLTTTFDRLALITQETVAASGGLQIPVKAVAPGKPFAQQAMYQLQPTRPAAEAVVQSVQPDDTITFWLGGVSARSLEACESGSVFNVLDETGQAIGEVEQLDRVGLTALGRLKLGQMPQVGALLQEKLRSLPPQLSLNLGLENNLGADRDVIVQELAQLPQIKIVPINQQSAVDFIVGRLTVDLQNKDQVSGPDWAQRLGQVGLLTSSNRPILNTFGIAQESPQNLVARLRPRLKSLLARKLLNWMGNGQAAQLQLDVNLQSRLSGDVQAWVKGGRALEVVESPRPYQANSVIDIQIVNQEQNGIYLVVLTIGSEGSMTILHPASWDSPELAAIVKPQTTTRIPIEIFGPSGFFELLILASTTPLRETLRGMQTIARSRGLSTDQALVFDGKTRSAIDTEENSLQTVQNLLKDVSLPVTMDSSGDLAASQQQLDSSQTSIFSTTLQVLD